MAQPAVILLNYKRPQNIGRLVDAARAALAAAPIFLLDQGGDPAFRERADIAWREVSYERAAVNRGAGARIPLAAAQPFDLWLAIDDDTFLTPAQIAALAERLAAEPDRAHGVRGERLEYENGDFRFRTSLQIVDAPLSVLNQVYAFSRAQAQRAMALAATLGWPSWDAIGPIDDILLSCAADKPPLCHDLGPFELCPTADTPGIAVWTSGDFRERRADAARRLLARQAIAVFSPLTYRPTA
jgi:hypothetical protein